MQRTNLKLGALGNKDNPKGYFKSFSLDFNIKQILKQSQVEISIMNISKRKERKGNGLLLKNFGIVQSSLPFGEKGHNMHTISLHFSHPWCSQILSLRNLIIGLNIQPPPNEHVYQWCDFFSPKVVFYDSFIKEVCRLPSIFTHFVLSRVHPQ